MHSLLRLSSLAGRGEGRSRARRTDLRLGLREAAAAHCELESSLQYFVWSIACLRASRRELVAAKSNFAHLSLVFTINYRQDAQTSAHTAPASTLSTASTTCVRRMPRLHHLDLARCSRVVYTSSARRGCAEAKEHDIWPVAAVGGGRPERYGYAGRQCVLTLSSSSLDLSEGCLRLAADRFDARIRSQTMYRSCDMSRRTPSSPLSNSLPAVS